jgi:lipopolysaccharide transport system ATP-binding protein
MSDIALRVEGLGKRYRLGLEQASAGTYYRYKSLRDTLSGFSKAPVKTMRSALTRVPMNETNSFWALKDINFEVKKGEVVGIIGRNGAGKSTLLKILSRITKPTTGHVALFGRVGSLLEVGTGFHPELSGRENIYLNGAILGMTRAEVKSKFDEIVSFSEIEKFLDTPVKQYSSGMYMRLAFAVAAHLEPEILVVDEVLAVGDAEFQKKCLGKMKDVANEGRTVLFVSHNLSQVERLCETGLLMQNGRVIGHGPVSEQIAHYSRITTAPAEGARRRLLKDLELSTLTVAPASIRSGDPCTISFVLRAKSDTTLDDLCVVVCAEHDLRVAAMDLRGISVPAKLMAGEERTFKIRVNSLQLVERDYTVGMFARSSAGYDAIYGLATFEIVPPGRNATGAVYGSKDRGFLELEYTGGN